MSRTFKALKIAAVPLLFAAVSLGLATVHVAQERKAARAKLLAGHTAQVQDAGSAASFAGIKLKDLAPAVKKGDFAAEVEIARRLALGEGVKKDETQAAAHFLVAINQLGEIGPRDKRAPAAATACRFLAQFYRHGLPAANIAANTAYSFDLLLKAASYFGDPVAQYELAKLLIGGDGITRNTSGGIHWLQQASQKGYAPAQALLGDMQWRGSGLARARGAGLGRLAIARRNASPEDKQWISQMFEAARAEALPIEILQANGFIVQESGASPFNALDGGFLDGNTQQGATPGGKTGAIAAEQSALHRGSRLNARLNGQRLAGADSEPAAGIIQMYRPWDLQEAGEAPLSAARLAGAGS
jgi:uncharacterized protein